MKSRRLFFVLMLLSAGKIAVAQTTFVTTVAPGQTSTATGTVKDANGNFLHYAFVQDKKCLSRTFTDSLGNFIIQTVPNSALLVTCTGFRDTVVKVNSQTSFSIVLSPAGNLAGGNGSGAAITNANVVERNLSDIMTLNSPRLNTIIQQGSILPEVHVKGNTHGSRYFFTKWVHGYVMNAQDTLVQNTQYLFNYDKTTGFLLLTQDGRTVMELDKDKIRSFTLFGERNQPYTFTQIPAVDPTLCVQILSAGANYGLYKLTKTTFVKANFKTDGIMNTGNDYDEYQDEDSYYLQDAKTGQVQKIKLKKKAIAQAFGAGQNKANDYLQANKGDINDNYLKGLGDYMNK